MDLIGRRENQVPHLFLGNMFDSLGRVRPEFTNQAQSNFAANFGIWEQTISDFGVFAAQTRVFTNNLLLIRG